MHKHTIIIIISININEINNSNDNNNNNNFNQKQMDNSEILLDKHLIFYMLFAWKVETTSTLILKMLQNRLCRNI